MTTIISEIGVNWFGDIDIAKQMIHQSSISGADAVKFQLFNEKIIEQSSHKEKLSKMIIDESSLKELYEYSKNHALKFGASVMYPEAFDLLNSISINLDFLKIRYADRHNEELAVLGMSYCKRKKSILLVSTSYFDVASHIRYDINSLYHNIMLNDRRVFCLYCIPKYPPKLSEIDINLLNPSFFNGYSNHYKSIHLPILAISKGLEYVEIHTYIKNTRPIDYPVSLSFEELSEICSFRDLILTLEADKKEVT